MDEAQPRELEVIELVQAPVAPELHGRYLDHPKPATVGTSLVFIGWVIPKASRVLRIEILADDGAVAETTLNQLRPDLVSAFPDVPDAVHAGFRVTVNMERPPADGRLHVEAVLGDGVRVPVGSVRLHETARRLEEATVQGPAGFQDVTPDETRRRRRWLPWRR